MFDLIIIGGGPAGITAGIYAARKKLNTLLISKNFVGQVGKTSLIENWPGNKKISGVKFLERLKEHLEGFMININEGEEVIEIRRKKDFFEVITSEKDKYFTKSIIVASGANPRFLEVPGEKKFIGRGVSFCTVCDAPFFKEKIVAVIGGGNSGLEAALDLTKYAIKIYILEFSSEIKADELLYEKAKRDKKFPKFVKVKEINTRKPGKNLNEKWYNMKEAIYGHLGLWEEKLKKRKLDYVENRDDMVWRKIKGFVHRVLRI